MGQNDSVTFLFLPESRLSDIRALLDSYAVEVWKDGLEYLRMPLTFCGSRMLDPPHISTVETLFPAVDKKINLRLVQYEPPLMDDDRERATRWPFYVDNTLTVMLFLGDQWWEYIFSTDKTYQNREIACTAG